MTKFMTAATTAAICALSAPAFASQPEDKGISFQKPATLIAEEVHQFHNVVLMPVITIISLFVLALLVWVVVRYNKKANPTPARFSHNTAIEIIWTIVPILILLYIAVFSFDLLYKEDVIPDGKRVVYQGDGTTTSFVVENDFAPKRRITRDRHVDVYRVNPRTGAQELLANETDYTLANLGEDMVTVEMNAAPRPSESIEIIAGRSRVGPEKFLGLFGEDRSRIAAAPSITIKAEGFQWGWNYYYPDFGDFSFSALLTPKEELDDPKLYLLAATNDIVVPVGETVRVITTATDVIHSWTIPAFAIKVDAVPGRLNETWFQAYAEGTYYGQCSEICGINHAYMPISLRVVSRPEFDAWVNEQRELAGMEPIFGTPTVKLAGATASSEIQE